MATSIRIPEDQLERYFDTFTKHFLRDETTNTVEVEFLDPDWGDQRIATNAHLIGITYDPKDRNLEIEMEHGDHRAYSPREVWVEEEPDGFVRAIQVVRNDGTWEVVHVKRLAPSGSHQARRTTP